jgi:hypothetical protein
MQIISRFFRVLRVHQQIYITSGLWRGSSFLRVRLSAENAKPAPTYVLPSHPGSTYVGAVSAVIQYGIGREVCNMGIDVSYSFLSCPLTNRGNSIGL